MECFNHSAAACPANYGEEETNPRSHQFALQTRSATETSSTTRSDEHDETSMTIKSLSVMLPEIRDQFINPCTIPESLSRPTGMIVQVDDQEERDGDSATKNNCNRETTSTTLSCQPHLLAHDLWNDETLLMNSCNMVVNASFPFPVEFEFSDEDASISRSDPPTVGEQYATENHNDDDESIDSIQVTRKRWPRFKHK